MPCSKNFRRVAKNLWLSVFITIQNLPKDEPRMDHMDLTSSMLSAIICKRDDTELHTELVVMALHHPTEDTILTKVMALTNHLPTDTILISHHTMNMKNLMRNHTNQSMKKSHLNQNMKKSHTNINTSKSHTMIMKNLLTRIHTNKNMSPSHTMIMKPLITIPMSLISLSMSISKNIPIHLPNTSMATNNLSTRNMAAVIIITKN